MKLFFIIILLLWIVATNIKVWYKKKHKEQAKKLAILLHAEFSSTMFPSYDKVELLLSVSTYTFSEICNEYKRIFDRNFVVDLYDFCELNVSEPIFFIRITKRFQKVVASNYKQDVTETCKELHDAIKFHKSDKIIKEINARIKLDQFGDVSKRYYELYKDDLASECRKICGGDFR